MWPLIEVAVEPRSAASRGLLETALEKLMTDDVVFGFRPDRDTGQIILEGISERHLDAKIDLLRAGAIDLDVGQKHVALREILGCKAEITHVHKKQACDSGEFAAVKILFEPGEPASGFQFRNNLSNRTLPDRYVDAVERSLSEAKEEGPVAGFPMIDFKATLVDGKYHDLDSSVSAFEAAARAAFKELRAEGLPRLVEPIMKLLVITPQEHVDDVTGDLKGRRGRIESISVFRGNIRAIGALVPLLDLFDYAKRVSDMTEDRAKFMMQYVCYQVAATPEPHDDLFPAAVGIRA